MRKGPQGGLGDFVDTDRQTELGLKTAQRAASDQ